MHYMPVLLIFWSFSKLSADLINILASVEYFWTSRRLHSQWWLTIDLPNLCRHI